MNVLKVVNFRYLTEDCLQEILNLRNSDRVRMNMANKDKICLEEHLNFCRSLFERKDLLYFAVYVNDSLEGVIDFKSIDFILKKYESGSYFIERSQYNISYYANLAGFLIAKSLGLTKVSCYVNKENLAAMLLNTCKLKYKIIFEDPVYYYLEKDLSDESVSNNKVRTTLEKKFHVEFLL